MATKHTKGTSLDAHLDGTVSKTTGLDAQIGGYHEVGLDANVGGVISKTANLDSYILEHITVPAGSAAQDYTGQVGSISVGDWAVGNTSGTRGLLVSIIDSGSTGTLFFNTITGVFQAGETITRWPEAVVPIPNGDMEADSSWTSYGTAVTENQSSSQKHSGDNAWYVNVASPYPAFSGIQSATFETVTGGIYTLDFWCYPDYLDPINVRIISGDGSILSDTEFDPGTSDTWYNYQVEYTETAGGSSAQVVFTSHAANDYSWRYYIDDVTMTGITADPSNYMVASGSTSTPKPHLDAQLKKEYPVTTGMDAVVLAPFHTVADLPPITLSANFGLGFSMDANLPALEIAGQFGMQTEVSLPALEVASSITKSESLAVAANLPVLTVESRFGLRSADDIKLPTLELASEISGSSAFRLDRSLAPLEIEAAVSTPGVLSVNVELPPLEITATASREQSLDLDATLPTLSIESAMGTYVFDADVTLPSLKVASTMSREGALSLDAGLPALKISSALGAHGLNVEGTLPSLGVASTMSREGRLSLDKALPALKITSSMGAYALNLDKLLPPLKVQSLLSRDGSLSLTSTMPALKIGSSLGAHGLNVEGTLPSLGVESALSREGTLSADVVLPALKIASAMSRDATMDADATMPALKVVASLDNYSAQIDSTLPNLKVASAMSRAGALAVDAKLPFLEVGSTMSEEYGMAVAANLPTFKLLTHIYAGQDVQFDVDSTLPALTISSTGTVGTFLEVDSTLPAIVIDAVGTGGRDGTGAGMTQTGRFDDYILRHTR